ncbi:MAG: methylenetetrahydrofolate reductase (NADPH) [Flavobacteriales bacterium]|jgi:methylenetetrahydrofolate reductase (NADPH)
MKVTDHLEKADQTLVSFEILPPLKGQNIKSIFQTLDPLMEFKPPFIDVTYHREEVVYKHLQNGFLEAKTVRKRPGTVGICAAIKNKYDVDAIPHIICGGFTKEETENALIELDFLGIENVLLLRGDAAKQEKYFQPTQGGHEYAIDLLKQVDGLNKGQYLDEELLNTSKTNFCIGVAGYPEKHFEAPNIKSDLNFLKQKVDAGADYIVTQMFFDNQKYFQFVEDCRNVGIMVPIIPGLKPLSVERHLKLLPNMFHIDIPENLVKSVNSANSKEAISQVGREWLIQQSKELKEVGVPCIHYYTMGKGDEIQNIVRQVF